MTGGGDVARSAMEALRRRCSCRDFTGEAIDPALLDEMIDVGLAAASGGNLQPYRIIVVRDPETKRTLRPLAGGQAFVERADVLLAFVLDWNRYARYTQMKHAPFRANEQMMHLIIAVEDILCAAQTIESCAQLNGLGACYVGGVLDTGAEISRVLELPTGCYPIVLLALGHPAPGSLRPAKKLRREIMVSNERYRPLSDDEIFGAYEEKYAAVDVHALPRAEEARARTLGKLAENLRLTYPKEQARAYLEEIERAGAYNEAQRRYGIHYGVADIRACGHALLQGMAERGCDPLGMERGLGRE